MAARAWCTAREARRLGTKPECALESVIKEAWYTFLLRIRIDHRRRRIGLVFWVQRHRYWTLERALGILLGASNEVRKGTFLKSFNTCRPLALTYPIDWEQNRRHRLTRAHVSVAEEHAFRALLGNLASGLLFAWDSILVHTEQAGTSLVDTSPKPSSQGIDLFIGQLLRSEK